MVKKKNNRAILFITIAVLIAVLVTIVVIKAISSNEGYRTISVIETSGTVVVVKDGREYQAYSGMKLQEGYELVTSGNSYARLVLDGDKYIKVEAGSKMVFETLGMLGSGKTRLSLERGAMTSELVSPLKTDEEYVVNTPNAVLAVRGTYFRLDLKPTENGEIVADIATYGGKVATKRVQPSGEVVEEEVLVEAGRKVCINMDEHKTSYVVEGIKFEETDEDVVIEEVTQPIKIEDIPDEDIVDIYYSAQNGHELFITEKEVEEKIKDRDIKLEEYVPVYKKAKEVEKKQEGKLVETEVYADDSKPIAIAPEQGMDGEIPKENQIIVGIAPTDGDGVHTHAYVESVSKEATCTEAGEKTFTCECGETYTEELSMLGHTKVTGGTVECHSKCSVCDAIIEDGTMHIYTDAVTASPTCTLVGEKTFTCECGHVFKEEIPMTEHTKVAGANVDCHSKCSVCELVLEDGTKHVYTEMITKEATHSEDGIKTYTCECGYGYEVPIPAQQHIKVNGGTKDCHSKCSDCGAVLEDAMSHSYTTTVLLEPTCTADGTKRLVCACGYEYLELIPALGHDYAKEYSVDKESTCTEVGRKSRHCLRCESISGATQIPMIAHIKVSGGNAECHSKCGVCEFILEDGTKHVYTEMVTKEATHSEDGIKTYTCECGYGYEVPIPAQQHIKVNGGTKDCHSKCSDCGAVLEDAMSHSYTTTVLLEPTCIADGTKRLVCACGYEYLELIPALGHDYAKEYSVDKEPTCTAVGSKSRHCVRCESKSGVTQIPMIAHIKVSGGTKDCHSKCSVCGNTIEDATAHSYAETVTKQPTCTEVGTMLYTCSCGYKYSGDIAALGHDYPTKYTTDKEPTCTEVGSKSKHCSRCDSMSEITQISATGHSYVDKIELPTNTSDGRDYEKCNACGDEINEIPIIAINAVNFPDETVRTYVEANFNSNGEAGLRPEEIAGAISFEIEEGKTVTSLKGVEHLTALEMLFVPDASGISDGEIDVTKNTALTTIALPNAKITNLDVSNSTGLQMLMLTGTDIANLDVSANDELLYLYVDNSKLTSLDTSTLSGLYELSCENTGISEIDLSSSNSLSSLFINGCDKLTSLDVSGTSLSEITLSDNTNLETIDISYSDISTIDLSNNKKLVSFIAKGYIGSELVISDCTELTSVELSYATSLSNLAITGCSAFTTHDFSTYSSLKTLDISGSGIESISMTNNTSLTTLTAQENESLETLTLSGCSALVNVDVTDSVNLKTMDVGSCASLDNLDISTLSNLDVLDVSETSLTEIDVSNNVLIEELDISDTQISYLELFGNTALKSLEARGYIGDEIAITDSPGLALVDLEGASGLIALTVNNTDALKTLDLSSATGLNYIDLTGCSALESVDFTGCADVSTLIMCNAHIAQFDISGLSGLLEIYMDNSSGFDTLDVSSCTGLVGIDMNYCKDIQTFNASGCEELSEVNFVGCSGIKTVDMSGTKMVTLGLNVLSGLESFKAENCASLKVFSCSGNEYLESIDISGCSALTNINIVNCKNLANIDLENDNSLSFVSVTGSDALENLDLSGFTSIQTVTATALTALKSFNVSGCSALSRVDLTDTDGLDSFVVTDAGNQSSTGKLQFSLTAADTYYTTDITGWNSLYMEITTSS